MKNLQVTKKLLSVALLVSVASQAVALPGMEDAKRWAGNVADFLKPYPNLRPSHANCDYYAYDVVTHKVEQEGGFSGKTRARMRNVVKPLHTLKLYHPRIATAGKYAAIAAVAAGLGYGAYKVYNKYFAKNKAQDLGNLELLKAAAQSIVEINEQGDEEVPMLTVTFTEPEVEALVRKLDDEKAQALTKAVEAFDQALGVWEKKPSKAQKNAAVKKAHSALNDAVDACNKVLKQA